MWEFLRLKLNTELSTLQEKELLSDRKVLRMASSWYICHNTLVTGNYSYFSHRWLAHTLKLLSTTSHIAVKTLNLRRIADAVLLITKNSVTALIEGTACEAGWLLWSCSLTHNATCSGIDQPIKWVLEFSRGKQNLSPCLGYFNDSIWSWATTAAAACAARASVHRGLTCHKRATPPPLRLRLGAATADPYHRFPCVSASLKSMFQICYKHPRQESW